MIRRRRPAAASGAGLRCGVGLIACGCADRARRTRRRPTRRPRSAPRRPSSATAGTDARRRAATVPTSRPPPTPCRRRRRPAARRRRPPGLTAASLPVRRAGERWRSPGGDEEGFEGNGTWVHARDPRYAAQDVITLGCATGDPRRLRRSRLRPWRATTRSERGRPGIGLVLEFATSPTPAASSTLYTRSGAAPAPSATGRCGRRSSPSVDGLVDRRTYPDSDWTEIGRQTGRRVTLIILTDPGHADHARCRRSASSTRSPDALTPRHQPRTRADAGRDVAQVEPR